MNNIDASKIKIAKTTLISLIAILLFSCIKTSDNEKIIEYYYTFDDKPSNFKFILKKQIIYLDSCRRREKNFSIENDSIRLERSELYLIHVNGMEKLQKRNNQYFNKPYLTIASNECIKYEYEGEQEGANDFAMTQICFLGTEDVYVWDKKYTKAYKFKKTLGLGFHPSKSIVFYDSNFVLIKEQWIKGEDSSYMTMERLPPVVRSPNRKKSEKEVYNVF
jgi:hypothetical protein